MYQRRIPEVRSAVQATGAVVLALLLGPTACSQNASVVVAENGNEGTSTSARFGVPPGHLPPVGQCRIWMPGEPPGQQKKKYPVGRCSTLRLSIPEGGWLIYRPTTSKREIFVWEYGSHLEVLAERVYDAETGELLRNVTPSR